MPLVILRDATREPPPLRLLRRHGSSCQFCPITETSGSSLPEGADVAGVGAAATADDRQVGQAGDEPVVRDGQCTDVAFVEFRGLVELGVAAG